MARRPERGEQITPDIPKDRADLSGPRLGLLGWLRWAWRQLTSMRTALILLLLLAVAAIPGSIWPQRSVDPARVRDFFADNPDLAPWLDRLFLFDVFSSPWFAAIYLLLTISLVGCILPRTWQHALALRARPPRAPRRLDRFEVRHEGTVAATPEQALDRAGAVLRSRRFRVRADSGSLTAEKGYLKETGNIIFHLGLLGIILAFALGHLLGWRGEIIIREGETWTADPGTFDSLQFGSLATEESIPTFSVTMNSLDVDFESEDRGAQFGQPRKFIGHATVEVPGQDPVDQEFQVNHPISVDGDSVFLLGNGYAPEVTVRDPDGEVLFSDAVTFLPQDNNYSSSGAIKVPAADPQLGFEGGFMPTLTFEEGVGPTSAFPGLLDPALVLAAFRGDLYPEGRPQSVFSLDPASMDQVMQEDGSPFSVALRPGETVELPDGTTLEMTGVKRWAGLLVRHDPGRMPALVLAGITIGALALMLGVRRRRIYVRAVPVEGTDPTTGHTAVTVAGLPKGTDPGLDPYVRDLLERITVGDEDTA